MLRVGVPGCQTQMPSLGFPVHTAQHSPPPNKRGMVMFKKWLLGGVAVIAGVVVWNEYRLWTYRHAPGVLQTVRVEPASEDPVVAANAGGEEESDAFTLIDLTPLQRQTNEPPLAIFGVGVVDEAVLVPAEVKFRAEELPMEDLEGKPPADF